MALLRSPDGSWTGEILLPEDVVNLKTRGYTVVEPELDGAEPEVVSVTVALTESVAVSDKPNSK